jgi:hypothetical protein
VRKVIGIYSETCNLKHPVIGRADVLFDLLDESRADNGNNAIDYAESGHGDFHTIVDTVDGLLDYAALLDKGAQSGASGAYHRAIAKGIREAVEDDDLLDEPKSSNVTETETVTTTLGTTRVENGTTVCRMPESSTLAERIESVIFWLEAQRDEYPNDWTSFTANALDEMRDLRLINQERDAAAIASLYKEGA